MLKGKTEVLILLFFTIQASKLSWSKAKTRDRGCLLTLLSTQPSDATNYKRDDWIFAIPVGLAAMGYRPLYPTPPDKWSLSLLFFMPYKV